MNKILDTKKIIAVTILGGQLFFVGVAPAQALFGGLKVPSASSIATDIEKRYNLDLENIQDQGQLFNVSANKQPAPEVSLFFSPSDPRQGEKITAKAFPVYFTNKEQSLYYSWYLKRVTCDLDNSPSRERRELCDRDSDNRITVEDWKIEASLIMAQNGYDSSATNYDTDTDDDGYRARFGGDNKTNSPNYCYIHDTETGQNYELADTRNVNFSCPSGTTPVCMVEDPGFDPSTIPGNTAGNSVDGSTFTIVDTDECYISGLPVCNSLGQASCSVGTPRCVTEPTNDNELLCGTPLTICSADTDRGVDPYCRHLFPEAPGEDSGDGTFGAAEEEFWRTDPQDASTADNGNKDEANVVGFGRSSFTWNYITGDQVGVAVEGTSMIPTKHENSAMMIMWAFPKQDCPLSLADRTGAYFKRIKNYSVEIETADMDLNKCIERNLIDPTEGGQATNLEVTVGATPEEPLNDESGDGSGDSIFATAAVSNGDKNIANTLFDWNVEISNNIQFNAAIGPTANITNDLQAANLLGTSRGNALDTVEIKLNIPRTQSLGGRPFGGYLVNDVAYLRISTRASENFESGVTRKGNSDIIVKFISTGRKIVATQVTPVLVGDKMQVSQGSGAVICNDDALDRNLCRVIENEIIGLSIDGSGLSNFQWSVNDGPLICTKKDVSPDCEDSEQVAINFLPVTGKIGDTYRVNVTANDVISGKTVTLSRSFRIIEPTVNIVSVDQVTAWPKFLGQYRDITGRATECPGGLCNDFSTTSLQTNPGNAVNLEAKFIPGFLSAIAEREWYIDGVLESESTPNQILYDAPSSTGMVSQVEFLARVTQDDDIRRALYDIWNISPLSSTEVTFGRTMQVEVSDSVAITQSGPAKYYAAIVSYMPASLIFALRVLLSGVLILFAVHFLSVSLQDKKNKNSI